MPHYFWTCSVIFLILKSHDGFESNCPETKFLTINHFLKPFRESNCPEVHYRTMDSYFQSNDYISTSHMWFD